MRAVLRALRRPEHVYRSIIVAGTNGKGSTSATLASILTASGYKTGLYTSPHLVDLREQQTEPPDFSIRVILYKDCSGRHKPSTIFT